MPSPEKFPFVMKTSFASKARPNRSRKPDAIASVATGSFIL